MLSGEGAKAAFQAGIIKRLAEDQIEPDIILGSSSGAITAALYSLVGIEGLERLWRDVKGIGDVFKFQWLFPWRDGIFDTKPVAKKLAKIFEANEFQIPAMVNRVNIETASLQRLWSDTTPKDMFFDATLAAIAIPGVVNPVKGWADGGSVDLVPLKAAIDRGAEEIYVLLSSPPGYPKAPSEGSLRFAKLGLHFIEIILQQNLIADIALCLERNRIAETRNRTTYRKIKLRVFGPSHYLYHPLDFEYAANGLVEGYLHPVEYDPGEYLQAK